MGMCYVQKFLELNTTRRRTFKIRPPGALPNAAWRMAMASYSGVFGVPLLGCIKCAAAALFILKTYDVCRVPRSF